MRNVDVYTPVAQIHGGVVNPCGQALPSRAKSLLKHTLSPGSKKLLVSHRSRLILSCCRLPFNFYTVVSTGGLSSETIGDIVTLYDRGPLAAAVACSVSPAAFLALLPGVAAGEVASSGVGFCKSKSDAGVSSCKSSLLWKESASTKRTRPSTANVCSGAMLSGALIDATENSSILYYFPFVSLP